MLTFWMMIGLQRHTVRVVEYSPKWASLGEDVCRKVRNAGGELLVDVQHVGSTAVPGLPSKPILDVAVAVGDLDVLPKLIEWFGGVGFLYRGDRGDDGDQLFVMESSPEVRTTHLHVVEHGGTQWNDYLRFRDLLRHNPSIRNQYADLKQQLAIKFSDDRASYTASKQDFIWKYLR